MILNAGPCGSCGFSSASRRCSSSDTRPGSGIAIPQDGPNTIIDAYAQVVLIANRRNVNRGISVATPDFLDGFLGKPRDME